MEGMVQVGLGAEPLVCLVRTCTMGRFAGGGLGRRLRISPPNHTPYPSSNPSPLCHPRAGHADPHGARGAHGRPHLQGVGRVRVRWVWRRCWARLPVHALFPWGLQAWRGMERSAGTPICPFATRHRGRPIPSCLAPHPTPAPKRYPVPRRHHAVGAVHRRPRVPRCAQAAAGPPGARACGQVYGDDGGCGWCLDRLVPAPVRQRAVLGGPGDLSLKCPPSSRPPAPPPASAHAGGVGGAAARVPSRDPAALPPAGRVVLVQGYAHQVGE